jgi:hypothetical protein
MSLSQHLKIRTLLAKYEDGLTTVQIATALELKPNSVRRAITNMKDVYVDRWLPARQGMRERAVHIWVKPPAATPENCPRPKPNSKD